MHLFPSGIVISLYLITTSFANWSALISPVCKVLANTTSIKHAFLLGNFNINKLFSQFFLVYWNQTAIMGTGYVALYLPNS